jgi:hypothetical protein
MADTRVRQAEQRVWRWESSNSSGDPVTPQGGARVRPRGQDALRRCDMTRCGQSAPFRTGPRAVAPPLPHAAQGLMPSGISGELRMPNPLVVGPTTLHSLAPRGTPWKNARKEPPPRRYRCPDGHGSLAHKPGLVSRCPRAPTDMNPVSGGSALSCVPMTGPSALTGVTRRALRTTTIDRDAKTRGPEHRYRRTAWTPARVVGARRWSVVASRRRCGWSITRLPIGLRPSRSRQVLCGRQRRAIEASRSAHRG